MAISGTEFDLSRLLAPLEVSEFVAEYWERRPLILARTQPDYYAGLLAREELHRSLSLAEADGPSVGVVGRQEARIHRLESHGESQATLSPEELLAEYQRGATLKFSYLDRQLEPLSAMCRSIERQLSGSVGTEIYLTPAGSQGFAAHHDIYNVFVLQLEGSKHWRIYDTPVPLPRTGEEVHDDDHPHEPVGAILHELELAPGDLLYFPRGFVHEALTAESDSLSITIGVQAYTWTDLIVKAFLARDARDPRFREALPANFATLAAPTDAMRAQFSALLRAFGEEPCLDEALANLAERSVGFSHPPLDASPSDVVAIDNLTLASVVRKRTGLAFRLYSESGDMVRLTLPQLTIRLPRRTEAALRYILDSETFVVGSLPDSLSANGKLVLVRRLVREGLLTEASAADLGKPELS